MAAITAALIKQVREETGAGMMDVKKKLLLKLKATLPALRKSSALRVFRPLVSVKAVRLRKAPSLLRLLSLLKAKLVTQLN